MSASGSVGVPDNAAPVATSPPPPEFPNVEEMPPSPPVTKAHSDICISNVEDVCATLTFHFAPLKIPLFQHPTHPHETPQRPSVGNPLSEQVSRRYLLTQQIRDCEESLGTLRNELEQTDMVIKTLQGADTAMQRFWEGINRLPPVSLVDPNVTTLFPQSYDDADSFEANISA